MWKFYKLIDKKIYFFLFIHLIVHFIKIKTNRLIVTKLNNMDVTILASNFNDGFFNFILFSFIWIVGNFILNMINRYTNYKVKSYINKNINQQIYIKTLKNIKNNNVTINSNNEKHFIQLFDNISILDRIFERLLFTIPKIIIYVIFYLHSLLNFSYFVLLFTFLFNIIGVYLLRKLNNLKKTVVTKLYDLEVESRNEHIKFIKEKDEIDGIIKIQDEKVKYKKDELFYIHINNTTNELFSDVLLCFVYCYGFKYLIGDISPIKPIELMYMGVNSSNFMSFIIDFIDNYNGFKQDLIHIGSLNESIN